MTAANCQFGKMSVKVLTRIVVNRMTDSNNPNDSADEPTFRQAERPLSESEQECSGQKRGDLNY